MDVYDAVERLNGMTSREIVQEAWYLPCTQIVGDAERCLIANLLRHWGVPRPSVGYTYISAVIAEEQCVLVDTPERIRRIISDFDRLEMGEFADKYGLEARRWISV